jgi:hypothetical protein
VFLGGSWPSGALAMAATRPAAWPTLTFLQLLLRAPNAALSGGLLLGVLDPADELVAGQGRDVLPGIKRRSVGNQHATQVSRQSVHHPSGHPGAIHGQMVVSRRQAGISTSGRARRRRKRSSVKPQRARSNVVLGDSRCEQGSVCPLFQERNCALPPNAVQLMLRATADWRQQGSQGESNAPMKSERDGHRT